MNKNLERKDRMQKSKREVDHENNKEGKDH
jgi:hypothetical protein